MAHLVGQPPEASPPSRATLVSSPSVARSEQRASELDSIISRAELASLGSDRRSVAREIRRGRWVALGLHSVAVHRGPIDEPGAWRAALHEVGSHASLDGVSALRAAGLTGFTGPICISVPHGWQPRRIPHVTVKELRDWREDDVIAAPLRRVRPGLAAIRAAAWARTDREAALLLVMTVQQRIARAEDLTAAVSRFHRLRRRRLIEAVMLDICDGVQALGELDFARACRRRGLPEPNRQVVRTGPRGRVYLDNHFDGFDLVVEIEGAHHDHPDQAIDDAIRQNHLSTDQTVLRIPVIGWRTTPDVFMDQVEHALRSRGWRPSH